MRPWSGLRTISSSPFSSTFAIWLFLTPRVPFAYFFAWNAGVGSSTCVLETSLATEAIVVIRATAPATAAAAAIQPAIGMEERAAAIACIIAAIAPPTLVTRVPSPAKIEGKKLTTPDEIALPIDCAPAAIGPNILPTVSTMLLRPSPV